MDDPQDVNSELESFREKWRAEVRAKNTATSGSQQQETVPQPTTAGSHVESSKFNIPRPPRSTHLSSGKPRVADTDEDHVQDRVFDEQAPVEVVREEAKDANKEPVSALEHYELAVEKEGMGRLGESLTLYRKAFRMDHKVDQKFKTKHYAAAWSKPAAQTAKTKPTKQDQTLNSSETKPATVEELIASFAGLAIEGAQPPIKGMPSPPCPIASLPEEILVHILQEVAIADIGNFVRLCRVCKRFAWLIATEDSIWRQVCLGTRFGFVGMQYDFQTQVDWRPIPDEALWRLASERGLLDAGTEPDMRELVRRREEEAYATTIALLHAIYHSWYRMFRQRPRIRFNGCYISTVNYIRPGAQTNSVSWNSPVHIVTYFRYLRLFRDGTAISLCTVEEPAAVVHHMTKEAMKLHKGGAMAHLPSSVMQHALRARWKLSSAADYEDKEDAENGGKVDREKMSLADSEGDLIIENEGGGNYLYRMELSLRSAGRGARNNKLVWRGFYSFNKTSELWDEFTLKNDNSKPWFFSRVKSYGFGEGQTGEQASHRGT